MMSATATDRWIVDDAYLAEMDERRPQLTELYVQRLTRLLETPVSDDYDLSSIEQRRLRSRAVLHTVRTLTAMGQGEAASALLRQARRQQ
jgi:hypothetical protein